MEDILEAGAKLVGIAIIAYVVKNLLVYLLG